VFKDGSKVDWRGTNQDTSAYTVSVVVLLENTVDTAEGRLLKSEMGMS
jgi:hypothetical protein